MEVKIFNTTQEELSEKRHNIFIGISVGVKPMSVQMATDYLTWAQSHASGVVQILIADEIARYNYLVFSHSTVPGALSRSMRDGDAYRTFFDRVISSKFSGEQRASFNILRWKDIKGERFLSILKELRLEFERNTQFQEDLFSILDPYVKRRGKSISFDQMEFLANYLMEELATLLDGIYFNGINYRLILYPTYRYSGMSQLVSEIQTGRRYPNLQERLTLRPTIMVESLIED